MFQWYGSVCWTSWWMKEYSSRRISNFLDTYSLFSKLRGHKTLKLQKSEFPLSIWSILTCYSENVRRWQWMEQRKGNKNLHHYSLPVLNIESATKTFVRHEILSRLFFQLFVQMKEYPLRRINFLGTYSFCSQNYRCCKTLKLQNSEFFVSIWLILICYSENVRWWQWIKQRKCNKNSHHYSLPVLNIQSTYNKNFCKTWNAESLFFNYLYKNLPNSYVHEYRMPSSGKVREF